MLWPVKFYSSGDPRTGKSYQSRFDYMVIIYKMALLDLVVSHLNASSQLRKYHHLYIFVFKIDSLPFFVNLLVTDRFDDRVWIDHTAGSLIDSFLQENRILFRFPNFIRWDQNRFSPRFYHEFIFFAPLAKAE